MARITTILFFMIIIAVIGLNDATLFKHRAPLLRYLIRHKLNQIHNKGYGYNDYHHGYLGPHGDEEHYHHFHVHPQHYPQPQYHHGDYPNALPYHQNLGLYHGAAYPHSHFSLHSNSLLGLNDHLTHYNQWNSYLLR